ncbi:hypothetical protein HDG37_001758 [Paraburkholderia sp. MM5384-R2]|nr:hypothetical protein [Paraburkholderia sp. MM5384-R2]
MNDVLRDVHNQHKPPERLFTGQLSTWFAAVTKRACARSANLGYLPKQLLNPSALQPLP